MFGIRSPEETLQQKVVILSTSPEICHRTTLWNTELVVGVGNVVCVVQSCTLKFGSWTYDGFMLDISFYDDREEVDISDYVISNEWELLDQPGRRNVRYYACCGDQPYPDLTFILRMRRLSVFYQYTIMLPCVLLSCLTAVIFWLPPESPAKIMLGLLSPLSSVVYQWLGGGTLNSGVNVELVLVVKFNRNAD